MERKGTTVRVLDRDDDGNATDRVEMDTDGGYWHVKGDDDPVSIAGPDDVEESAPRRRRRSSGDSE